MVTLSHESAVRATVATVLRSSILSFLKRQFRQLQVAGSKSTYFRMQLYTYVYKRPFLMFFSEIIYFILFS